MAKVVLLGGKFDRYEADLSKTPPVIVIGSQRYVRIDDPDDSGIFLGAYAYSETSEMKKLTEIKKILTPEWIRGRVLPMYLGSEDVARLRAIRRVMDEE